MMDALAVMPKYQAYKESGVDWLGSIPSNWQMSKLKNTVNGCVNGLWGSEPNGKNEVVVRVADFDDQKLKVSDAKLTYRSITENERKERLLKNGDLLIEKSGGGEKTLVGRVVLFDKNYTALTSNFVAKMSPKDWVDNRFLKYVFSCLYSRGINYLSIKQTTGIQNLDAGSYLNETFCFPEKMIQEEIANFLDNKTEQIDEAIAIKETQIELLKERKQIIIQKAVTQGLNLDVPMKDSGVEWIGQIPAHWEFSKLRYYTEILSGYAFKSESYSNSPDDVPLLRGINVSPNHTRWNEVVYWPRTKIKGFENYQLEVGDLVIAMDRPWVSGGIRVAEISDKDIPCLLLQRVGRIRGINGLLTSYAKLLLSTDLFLNYFAPMLTGISVPYISPEQIQNFICPIPSVNEQEQIIEYIGSETGKIEAAIGQQKSQMENLKEYKATLVNSAVTGKIKVA